MSSLPWPNRSPAAVARALAGHATLGIAAAALLYILTVSGLTVVFNAGLQRWEQPSAPEMQHLDPQAAADAAKAVMAREDKKTHHLFVHLPTDDLPRLVVTTDSQAIFADADGRPRGAESHPWTQFLLDLHYYLHVPRTAGLTLVGMLGVLMVALAVSGLLAHPRIFRDAFTLRPGASPRTLWADIHNRLSVWTAPFLIAVALTGAALGLATGAAAVIAQLDHDGDVNAVFGEIFGPEHTPDKATAPLADIAGALDTMATRFPNVTPTYVLMEDPGTQGQQLQILAEHPGRLAFGEYYMFDERGRFTGTVGMTNGTIGQQVVAATYRLHFGSFAGWPVKVAYAVFGLALAVIIASGLSIYFARRQNQRRAAPKLAAAWSGVVWGVPASLALTLVAAGLGATGATFVPLFWIGTIAAVAAAPAATLRGLAVAPALQGLTAAALWLAMALHAWRYGDAVTSPAGWPLTLTFIALGAAFAALAWRRRPGGKAAPVPAAAE